MLTMSHASVYFPMAKDVLQMSKTMACQCCHLQKKGCAHCESNGHRHSELKTKEAQKNKVAVIEAASCETGKKIHVNNILDDEHFPELLQSYFRMHGESLNSYMALNDILNISFPLIKPPSV